MGDGFPAAIRQSAQEALASGAQEDEECKKGCNWIGGIRLSWTSPPTVREVKRHVQEHFPRPIKPGDALRKVDGKSVDGLNRREILGLLRKFKGSVEDSHNPVLTLWELIILLRTALQCLLC